MNSNNNAPLDIPVPAPEAPAVKPPIPTGFFFIGGLALFLLVGASGLLGWVYLVDKPDQLKKHGASRLPVMGVVPDFTLTDQTGAVASLQTLMGKPWVADFIYTRCAGPCVVMSGNLEDLARGMAKAPALKDRVRLVSFTVDPKWDTPAQLGQYASQFKADPNDWLFLTGPFEDIQKLGREGFKLGIISADPGANEPIIHSQSLILMDKSGMIRGYYDGTNASEVQKLYAALEKLVTEP